MRTKLSFRPMSDKTKGLQELTSSMPWLVSAVVAGVGVVAAISYVRSQETHAASGSPLYERAVNEAITGLKNPAEKVTAARPALPAGLSPDEHYWCESCQAYHKRQAAEGQPAGVAPPPLAAAAPATPLTPAAGTPVPGSIPPLPAGLSADDYYWCADCKGYHKRQPGQDQPAGAAVPPGTADHPAGSAAQPAGTVPPLPAGLSPNDYYWCTNCKAYHLRQPAAPAIPAGGATPVTPAPVTPAPVTPAPVPPAAPAVPAGETQPAPAPPTVPEVTPAAPPAAPPAAETTPATPPNTVP
jgi:hypothetical protein